MKGATRRVTPEETCGLDPGTIKQMIALYQAVQTARATYSSGGSAYKFQMELIATTADARNVKAAFQKAAESIGMTLN